MKDLATYLGSEEHLTSLGTNYAECGMPREVPAQWTNSPHASAFFAAYDSYARADYFVSGKLFDLPDAAHWAIDAIGDTKTNRYARDIATEATEYVSNADWGSSLALVEISNPDRVALTILDAAENARRTYDPATSSYVTHWEDCETNPEDWAEITHAVVYVDERGFGNPLWFTSEADARKEYEEASAAPEFADEDEEDEDETPTQWSDDCEHFAPLLGEVRRAEQYGGTE